MISGEMSHSPGIRGHARKHTAGLLKKLSERADTTALHIRPDDVHDLRTAIRRLRQCLKTFQTLFPKKQVKKIRSQLKDLMYLAGEVRDRDVVVEIISKAGGTDVPLLRSRLAQERDQAGGELRYSLDQYTKRNVFKRWQKALE